MIGLKRSVLLTGILLALAAEAGNLCAFAYEPATQVKLPNNVDPGAVSETYPAKSFYSETESSTQDTKLNLRNPADIEKPAVMRESRIQVKDIVFKGNTKIKTEVLRQLAADLIGKDVSIDDIKKVSAKITKLYRDKGYLTSLAYIAPQDINNGVLK